MIEMALGRYPYPPTSYENVFAQLSAIVHGDPPELPDEGYSEEARDFVARCLHRLPEMRPTYAELLVRVHALVLFVVDVSDGYHNRNIPSWWRTGRGKSTWLAGSQKPSRIATGRYNKLIEHHQNLPSNSDSRALPVRRQISSRPGSRPIPASEHDSHPP